MRSSLAGARRFESETEGVAERAPGSGLLREEWAQQVPGQNKKIGHAQG